MPALTSDVFGYKRNAKPRGVFSTEDSKLTFGSQGGGTEVPQSDGGYLVQNWQVNYQQDVQEVFEIGSNALYWSKGRPQGTGQLGRIIGDHDADGKSHHFFPEDAYDICRGGATLELKATGGHCAAPYGPVDEFATETVALDKELSILMSGALVTNIGFQMQVGNVRLMENMGWRFAYMQFM